MGETQHAYREGATHGVNLGLGDVNKLARFDWKERYWCFQQRLTTFGVPFIGRELDACAYYCSYTLRADLFGKDSGIGVHIEFEVAAEFDYLELSVVDFEANTVSFDPYTGI